MAQKSHDPTIETRQQIQLFAAAGTPQVDMCAILNISKVTLHKYYRRELDIGMPIANAVIAEKLFEKAKSGDTASMCFWLKCRANWSEKIEVKHSGEITIKKVERVITDPRNTAD